MVNRGRYFWLVLFALLFGVLGFYACSSAAGLRESVREQKGHPWEPRVFEEIDTVTRLADIVPLKAMRPLQGRMEIRFWRGFGLAPLEGVVLVSQGGDWKGWHIKADRHAKPEHAEMSVLGPPKSGWNQFWNHLNKKKILSFPDQMQTGCTLGAGYDGMGYVVEILDNDKYRNYIYGNAECAEANIVSEMAEFIAWQFDPGSEKCVSTEWFPCMAQRRSLRPSESDQ